MRLFFGIELDERARIAAVKCMDSLRRDIDARFVDNDNLHMTVCFVGEVDVTMLKRVEEIGEKAAILSTGRKLTLSKLGFFGTPSNAILYIGVDGAHGFASLSDSLKKNLTLAGLPCDPKRFSPHITIARRAFVTPRIINEMSPESITWNAGHLTLFDSARISGRLVYTPVCRWPLNR
ncbi:MAG: RNA 2',3'-cyclic phosphodiesterase [Clostridia bacterium]|nr:RNA 2',3'-cyclic phosphodiesterase [Clostridia bacterium]